MRREDMEVQGIDPLPEILTYSALLHMRRGALAISNEIWCWVAHTNTMTLKYLLEHRHGLRLNVLEVDQDVVRSQCHEKRRR